MVKKKKGGGARYVIWMNWELFKIRMIIMCPSVTLRNISTSWKEHKIVLLVFFFKYSLFDFKQTEFCLEKMIYIRKKFSDNVFD